MSGGLSGSLKRKLRQHLERLEARLQDEAHALRQSALERPLKDSVGELAGYDQHTSDLGSETHERSKDLGLLERVRTSEDEVRHALRRLDEGRYGYCEECGGFIGVGRLLAIPWARRCADCQRAHEAQERRLEDRPTGPRPLEEATLTPPFGRADRLDAGEAGLGPDDVWQLLAQHGNANSPQDVPGGAGYGETWEDAADDSDEASAVSEVEAIVDVEGTGVVDYQDVYPEPAGRGRRDAAGGGAAVVEGETGSDEEGDRRM